MRLVLLKKIRQTQLLAAQQQQQQQQQQQHHQQQQANLTVASNSHDVKTGFRYKQLYFLLDV
jgi:hypothetical protein